MSIADVSLVAFLHCYVEFLMGQVVVTTFLTVTCAKQHLILLDYKYIIFC